MEKAKTQEEINQNILELIKKMNEKQMQMWLALDELFNIMEEKIDEDGE